MSILKDQTIAVKILDRTYHIKCQPEAASELQSAAACLNQEMDKVKKSGKVNSTERTAIVAALNLAHELMQVKKQQNGNIERVGEEIKLIQERIQQFLGAKEPVAM